MVNITVSNEIILRSWEVDDAAALFRAVDKSRQHLGPWLNWVSQTTKPEHSLQFIKQSIQAIENQESLALGIFYDGIVVGGLGMHDWNHAVKKAQIGYWIMKEYEGRGIVVRSLQQFVRFLFEKTAIQKIEIHFSPANQRSAMVAERLGSKMEGIIRQSAVRNGNIEDLIITGILKSEWMTGRG